MGNTLTRLAAALLVALAACSSDEPRADRPQALLTEDYAHLAVRTQGEVRPLDPNQVKEIGNTLAVSGTSRVRVLGAQALAEIGYDPARTSPRDLLRRLVALDAYAKSTLVGAGAVSLTDCAAIFAEHVVEGSPGLHVSLAPSQGCSLGDESIEVHGPTGVKVSHANGPSPPPEGVRDFVFSVEIGPDAPASATLSIDVGFTPTRDGTPLPRRTVHLDCPLVRP